MIGETKQSWGHQRAVWDIARERVLVDVFDKTRKDPQLRTDRGLKAKGWDNVAKQVNDRCKSTFNVDQLRSKYSRLMMDYELFHDVGGERNLSDQDWDKLILDIPENAKRLHVFKESGFPHADVCHRISIGKDELTEVKQEKSSPHKRSSGSIGEVPDAKRPRQVFSWGPREKKLLLFLCWRAKAEREKSAEEGTKPQVWHDVTMELNQRCKTDFNEEQFKEKYLQLMQTYEQFKHVTGVSGDLEKAPKSDKDWDKLIQDRPEFSQELQRLKEKGGFPHIEVCSLISGDKSIDGAEPASVNEFLVMGALQRSEVKGELNTESVNAVAATQASLSANALSQLLPATSLVAPTPLHDTTGQPGAAASTAEATPGIAPVGTVPAVMTQELHDNLNMFLKTATAYLVMAINDHNQANSE